MNSKAIAIGLVGGAGLFMLWKMKGAGPRTPLGIPRASNSMGSVPRVDNQSQPWYVGPMQWATTKAQDYKQNPNLVQSDLTSVVKSTADIWGTVSGLFGNGSGETAQSVDDSDYIDELQSDDPTYDLLPASDITQSNMIGDQYSDYYADNLDTSIISSDYGDMNAYIDSSESDGGWGSDNWNVA